MTTKNPKSLSKRLYPNRKSSRRQFLAGTAAVGAGLAVGGPLILVPGRAKAAGKVSFAADGGRNFDIMKEVWLTPFQKETGIETIPIPTGRNVSKIKAQVETGNIEWDVIGLGGAPSMVAMNEGLLEPIDTNIVDLSRHNFPQWQWPSAVGTYYYFGGIAYRPSSHGAKGKHPRTWSEWWDVKGIPGRRGMRARPQEEMERALVADGVAPDKLYPLDENRAFKSLDRVKTQVKHWIKETPQTITLLQSKEIDFSYTYSARVEAAKEQGLDMEFVYDSVISTPLCFIVPKGSKNKDNAMKLINYFLSEKVQRNWSIRANYGIVNKMAADNLPPKTLARLPKLDDPRMIKVDVEYWAKNLKRMQKKYAEWLIT
jgi:putative spermidine/putrescine transport system substrate-binding protein